MLESNDLHLPIRAVLVMNIIITNWLDKYRMKLIKNTPYSYNLQDSYVAVANSRDLVQRATRI